MENSKQISLLLSNDVQIFCSTSLMDNSTVLSDMNHSCNSRNNLLRLPTFITESIIHDIIFILKTNDYKNLIKKSIHHLLLIVKTTDFLDIPSISIAVQDIIKGKITINNCFEIFPMTSDFFTLIEITLVSLELIMKLMEDYYENHEFNPEVQDPYIDRYKSMYLADIEKIIIYAKKFSTIAKIHIVQNWLKENGINGFKWEILRILERINEDASYIPRSKIIYMRKIRNQIIQNFVYS